MMAVIMFRWWAMMPYMPVMGGQHQGGALPLVKGAVGGQKLHGECGWHQLSPPKASAFFTTSSMVPTLKKAISG